MLLAISEFEDTEQRIYDELKHIRIELNEAIKAINHMKNWYMDDYEREFQIITTYQLTVDYIEKSVTYYREILFASHGAGNIVEFLSTKIKEVIDNASDKLPKELQIVSSSVIKIKTKYDNEHIIVSGYFLIIERNVYELIKPMAMFLKIENSLKTT